MFKLVLVLLAISLIVCYVFFRKIKTRITKVIDYCNSVPGCKTKYISNAETRGVYITLPSDKTVGPIKTLGELEKFATNYLNYDPRK